jgi:fructose-bisphosphate aldolase class I
MFLMGSDESNATTGKRLESVGVENSETNRRAWRELLYTAPGGAGRSWHLLLDHY